MANQKGRKPAVRKKKTEQDEGLKPYEDEIVIVITLVACILLILSNFHMCGMFGVWVSRLFFGLFGFMNYIVPVGIFVGMAFQLSNKGSKKAKRKLISILALLVVLMAILQLFYMPYKGGIQISEYYAASAESKKGGGMVGGLVSGILCYFFDEIASIVILFAIGLVLCMFITEKLFFAPMGRKGYQKVQEMKEHRRTQKEEYEKERKVERPQEKRKAKTFTIERVPEPEETVDKNGVIQKKNSDCKKEKTKRQEKKKTPVDMEEITPSGIETMSIIRGGVLEETGSMPVYEEEMMQKFNPVHAKRQTDLDEFDNEFSHAVMEREKKKQEKEAGKEELYAGQKKKTESVKTARQKEASAGNSIEKEASDMDFMPDNKEQTKVPIQTSLEPLEALEQKQDDYEGDYQVDFANSTYAGEEKKEQKPDNRKTKMAKENDQKTDGHVLGTQKEEVAANRQGDLVIQEMAPQTEEDAEKPYEFPTLDLLQKPSGDGVAISDEELKQTAMKLHNTLDSFGVKVTIDNVSCGPTVTRYELHPEQGVKVSRITGLADDIKLNLAAADIRIEAPIPGKAAVGIEVPNKQNTAVMLRELLESKEFRTHSSHIAFAVGKDIAGKTVVTDIAKMPHLLIAGATGSGKSVCINTLIMSILYKADPNDVKLIMIDPKVVELSVYNGIPHLLIPVVTDPKKASAALNWAVIEMTERYNKFAEIGVRNLKGYNEKVTQVEDLGDEKFKKMPEIVIIVDELADLMMVAPGEVEDAICRLAQLARAAGIHLVIATQRPSVNVITGVIKANIPSRIAFSVSSAVDSRTILDGGGAEKLLGKGDMLFYPSGYQKPVRVQGAFVSDEEVSSVVEFLTRDVTTTYDNAIVEKISTQASKSTAGSEPANDRDEYFVEAAKLIIEKDKASIGMLQRMFKIGFNRASRIMEQLYDAGIVGEEEGTKPRKVIMSMEQLEEFIDEYV